MLPALWEVSSTLIPVEIPQRCTLTFRLELSEIDGYRYYAMSVILGTVALSYGSVPMYKMVRSDALSLSICA